MEIDSDMPEVLLKTTVSIFMIYLAFVANSALADVHKCEENGKSVYTSKPCEIGIKKQVAGVKSPPPAREPAKPQAKGRLRKVSASLPSQSLIASCINSWRTTMKDPLSPYAVSARIEDVINLERPDVPPWQEIVVDARAKNSFGAYVPEQLICGVLDENNVDDKITDVLKAKAALGIDRIDDRYVK